MSFDHALKMFHIVTADVLIGAAGDLGNTALHAVFGCIVPCWLSHLDHIWQLSCFELLYAGKKRSERARKSERAHALANNSSQVFKNKRMEAHSRTQQILCSSLPPSTEGNVTTAT